MIKIGDVVTFVDAREGSQVGGVGIAVNSFYVQYIGLDFKVLGIGNGLLCVRHRDVLTLEAFIWRFKLKVEDLTNV